MQVFWLVVVVGVPLVLIVTRRSLWLLAWICLTTCVDVFRFLNFSATTFTGLLLLPTLIGTAGKLLKTKLGWVVLLQIGYLSLLGVVFGLLLPWPDDLNRPWSLQAPGRTALYLIRQYANLGLALFVAKQIVRTQKTELLFHYILIGGIVAAAAGVAERITGVSVYDLVWTGVVNPTYENLRVRGLNFEPRGLGLTAAHSIFLCLLLWAQRRSKIIVAALVLNSIALLLTRSVSGLIALLASLGVLLLVDRRGRWLVLGALLLTVSALGLATLFLGWGGIANWEAQLLVRVGSTVRFGEAENWLENIAYRMEIFDAVAVLFFQANPGYLIIGTGPGLISIPATPFLPVTPYTEFWATTGVNSPPTMGGLLELSNTGLVGLGLWLIFTVVSVQNFNYLAKREVADRERWRLRRNAFLGALAMYGVAAGFLSSFWPLFLGISFAVALFRYEYRRSPIPANGLFNGS